jgi:quercetin dioxygenase-like cupin family protein
MTEDQFRRQLREQGYGEARIREFEPNLDKDMHTHDQSAMALVMRGEFTLVLIKESTTYQPGEWCELVAGTSHTERTGPSGATVLLAYK